MTSNGLRIHVKGATLSRLWGLVADDGPSRLLREGTEARVFLNPPGTRFDDPSIIGTGRIYDNHVEVDLCLGRELIEKTVDEAQATSGAILEITVAPLTETIFRVTGVEQLQVRR